MFLEAVFARLVLETGLEEHFRDSDELLAHSDSVSIRKLVINCSAVSFVGRLKFGVIV